MIRLQKTFCFILLMLMVFLLGKVTKASDIAVSAGESLFNKGEHVEYIAGNLPVIISAPHGGRMTPTSFPDRTSGVLLADGNTDLLAREIAKAFHKQTGKYPHVIICHLKRIKVDCNREIKEAAQGNEKAEQVWKDFHGFIEQARHSVIEKFGKGLYIDLHGHGHPDIRLELGYLLSNQQLKGDEKDVAKLQERSSIRMLSENSKTSFVELLRGDSSIGGLMQERGFPAVPSPEFPHAGDAKYFNGGYNTRHYGSQDGGKISSFQLECPRKSVRDTEKNRKIFAQAFASAVVDYLETHVGSK